MNGNLYIFQLSFYYPFPNFHLSQSQRPVFLMPGVIHIWLMAMAAGSGFPISTNGQDVPLPPPSLITDSNAM